MTTDLVPIPSPTTDALALVDPASKLVDKIATTTFVPKEYRNKPGELLAAILTGNELDLPPMTAIAQIHNIEGRATLSAQVMRALVLSKGHDIWIEDASDFKVTLGGQRANGSRASFVTWTLDQAKAAGLAGKNVWRKYPRAMLLARATGELCRAVFPDVLAGIAYTTEEADDGILDEEAPAEGGEAITSEKPKGARKAPARKTTRKATGKAAPKSSAAAPAPEPAEAPTDALADFAAIDGAPAVSPNLDDDIAEAELVEEDEEAAASVQTTEEARALPPAQALARRAQEVGLDDDHRHALALALTGSRTTSGKDLTTEEIHQAFELLDEIEAGGAEIVWDASKGEAFVLVGGEEAFYGARPPETEQTPPDAADEDDSIDWAALAEEHGKRTGQVMLQARKRAAALGVDTPQAFEDLPSSDPALRVQLAAWIRGEA